jgi:hypothetical protein
LTTSRQVPTFDSHRSCNKKPFPRWPPKRAISKATISIDDAAKAALLAKKKGKTALADDIPETGWELQLLLHGRGGKQGRQQTDPLPQSSRAATVGDLFPFWSSRPGRRGHRSLLLFPSYPGVLSLSLLCFCSAPPYLLFYTLFIILGKYP